VAVAETEFGAWADFEDGRGRPTTGFFTGTITVCHPALEATQGQNDSFFSQLPYKSYLEEVAASVGD